MSTTIHPHHHAHPAWASLPRRPRSPVAALWHAVGAALVPGEATASMVPALQAADVQALLVRAGELDEGRRSAHWDRPTTDAVARFQRHRGLPCTGVADRRTADALLSAP